MAGSGMKYWKMALVMLVVLAACCGQVASQSIYAWLAALLTGGASSAGACAVDGEGGVCEWMGAVEGQGD